MRLAYAIREIFDHFDDPYWWRKRVADNIVSPIHAWQHGDEGIEVMAQDWDTLIILDACRADVFQDVVDLRRFDEYRTVTSQGSWTPEWLEQNFQGQQFGDTVYVSGNPFVSRYCSEAFHNIVDVWVTNYDVTREEIRTANGLADIGSTTKMVTAAEVTERAVATAEQYPEKRLIVHYVQPHAPYIGKADGALRSETDVPDFGPGRPLADGTVDRDLVLAYYRDNLKYALHHAFQLIEHLPGKTVISSDHGELLGERLWPIPIRGYSHPPGVRAEALVQVPWAVIGSDKRPSIVNEGVRKQAVKQEAVEDQLRHLGYVE